MTPQISLLSLFLSLLLLTTGLKTKGWRGVVVTACSLFFLFGSVLSQILQVFTTINGE